MKLTKLENAHYDSAFSLVGQGNLDAAAPLVASLFNNAGSRAKQKFFWLTAMRWGLVNNAGFVTAFRLTPTGQNNNRVPVLTGWRANASYNPEFLGAKPARAGEDY